MTRDNCLRGACPPDDPKTQGPAAGPSGLSARHWVFIGSIVALDFAFGLVFKSLLHSAGITRVVRLDMVVPMALLMLTRLAVDRFGVATAYQLCWATLAIFAMPGAMLPGPLKLLPALVQGLVYDAGFRLFRRLPRGRVFLSATAGGLLNTALVMLLRVWVLGLPWAAATQALLGVQALTSAALYAAAAGLALCIWGRIRDLPAARMLRTVAP